MIHLKSLKFLVMSVLSGHIYSVICIFPLWNLSVLVGCLPPSLIRFHYCHNMLLLRKEHVQMLLKGICKCYWKVCVSSSNWSSVVWSSSCFRFSYSSLPGSICSHFFVISSQNRGSSYPGYRLVIMELTSPPGVSVSIWQLTG